MDVVLVIPAVCLLLVMMFGGYGRMQNAEDWRQKKKAQPGSGYPGHQVVDIWRPGNQGGGGE